MATSNTFDIEDFESWYAYGLAQRWCGPSVCYTHDGFPNSAAEDDDIEGLDETQLPPIFFVRLYDDFESKTAVETSPWWNITLVGEPHPTVESPDVKNGRWSFVEWLEFGESGGWSSRPIDNSTESLPCSVAEKAEAEDVEGGSEYPCIHIIRLYASPAVADEVEDHHGPSAYRQLGQMNLKRA